MSVLRVCPGIRPRTWALLFFAGFGLWTVLAVVVWLVVGWLSS